jgi:hypothetical protein
MNQINNIPVQSQEYFVVLFSKYSNACKKFMDTINNAKLNLNFNYLCIDNKDIRNRVISSSEIDIKNVPCLLIINEQSGSIDKYEGQDSFIWINDIIQQKQKQLLEEQIKQQTLIQQQMQEQMHKQIQQQMMTQKNEIQQKLAERDIDESVKPIKKIKSSKKKTLIDDIDENLEDESIINDDFETENEVKLESSYRDYGGGGSGGKRAENKKRENLLSTAMQMQKTREIEDKSLNPTNKMMKLS